MVVFPSRLRETAIMDITHDLDEVAAKSAIACWFKVELPFVTTIQQQPLDTQLLDRWLVYWVLARTVPKPNREKLRAFLARVAGPVLLAADGPESYGLVEELSMQALRWGGVTGRPTSLISKFAFSCRPLIFVPYDRRARSAFRRSGYKISDHAYSAYMGAFNAEKKTTIERLYARGIKASNLPYRGQIMDDELFEMRVADRRLMLQGGFSPNYMVRDYTNSDFL
jgi:hypothetical protein